jgi:uridine phosphorylase
MSTGIGTDNIDIVMNELDAAVNIDPVTRTERTSRRRLRLYRLGTSGALQEDIPVNTLVASTHGLGFDGLMNYYAGWLDVNVNGISEAFRAHTGWDERLPYPYCAEGSPTLLAQVARGFIQGITATAPGFYGPQGREIRLASALPSLEDDLATFSYNGKRITNFEMETSALYGLGTLLGHDCLTVCVIIANRRRKEFTKNYADSVAQMVDHCLNQIASTT